MDQDLSRAPHLIQLIGNEVETQLKWSELECERMVENQMTGRHLSVEVQQLLVALA